MKISNLPRREKVLITVLAAVFVLSFGNFIFSQIHFPALSEKGVLSEGFVGHIRNINPLLSDFNDADRDISKLVFSGLVKYDPLEKNFFPDVAEKWERSKDAKAYTFVLRQNALWHDGTPVSVDDVIFTFRDVIQDPGFRNPILKNTFEGVEITAPDTRTVVFTLAKPNSYFISHLTIGLLPKHLLIETPIANLEQSSFQKRPIGSGPYQITGLKLEEDGDQVDLEAFKPYYGTAPFVEKIRILTFPDAESLISQRGALHAIGKLREGGDLMAELASDSRFIADSYTLNQFTGIFLNTENAFLKEKSVRQAMRLGLDKNPLVGKGEQRIDTIDLQNLSASAAYAPNAELAAQMLDKLGLKTGAEGFRIGSKGEKFSLTILVREETDPALLENLRNSWQNLGLHIVIEKANPEEFIKRVSERTYDLLLIGQNLGYNRDVYPLFHSSQIAGEGKRSGQNFANFRSFRTDGITEAIRKERDPADKEKLVQEFSNVLADEVPVIFLSTRIYHYALDKRISPFPKNASLDYHSDRFAILPYLTFSNF